MTIFLARPEAPPAGIRLAVKDLFDTAGVETTYGSAVFAGHVPQETATAVRLLEKAGYANVGKANLHEFAYGTTSENPHFGDVPNPRYPGRVAGGSSGGSAAAGDVGTCQRMLEVLAPGFEPVQLESLEELEVGVAWTDLADPLVRERVDAAAARFPRRRAVELPLVPNETYAVFMREVADVHRELYAENADLYGEDVRLKLEKCFAVRDSDVERAERLRREYREQVESALDGLDLVLTPTLPIVPPPLRRGVAPGDLDVREALIRFTYPFSSLGWPALALPCGSAEDGLPASLQIAGRTGADGLVLAAGALLSPL